MISVQDDLAEIRDAILPGYGFFGNGRMMSFACAVPSGCDFIDIWLDESPDRVAPSFHDVALYTQSTDKANQPEFIPTLPSKETSSSSVEYLRIPLENTTDRARLELHNGDLEQMNANRRMVVSFVSNSEVVSEIWNFSEQAISAFFDQLLEQCEIQVSEAQTEPLAVIEQKILKRISETRAKLDVKFLCQFLPMFEKQATLTDFQMSILALIVLKLKGKKASVPTTLLRSYRAFLHSRVEITRCEKAVNLWSSVDNEKHSLIVLSKHQIHDSKLITNKEKHLRVLSFIFPILERLGVNPMICYGTLLGAVRENDFISHDDDMDILYFDGSKSLKEGLQNRLFLADKLEEYGIKCGTKPKWNFHARVEGISVDLFPSWENGENLHVMMERGRLRPVPKEHILPRRDVEFLGFTFKAPANPERFLEDRYGSGWIESDPFHEWPWHLAE